VFRAQDVWFYVYEGALPDVMLSEAFLNDIPCVTHPGQKLIDTREREGDMELLAQCMKDYRDLVIRRYTHPECATSNLHMAHINTVLEHVHAGRPGETVKATEAKQPPEGAEVNVTSESRGEGVDSPPLTVKERAQQVLAEMQAQRMRLRQRLGKPVSDEALKAAEAVLDKYPRNFRPPGHDACNLAVFRIKLKDNTKYHIALPRRTNPIVLADMRRQVQELLEAGAIERCQSTPSSVYAVVMVRKPGQPGKWRLCLDLIKLNENTVPMPFAMPDVHEALDRLSGKKFYSSFDFTAWFQQFNIAEEDREKVAFIIPGDNITPPQVYQFKKMCFGLLNAGYWSQRQLQEALEKFKGCEGIYPFVDDVVIASDTLEEHLEKLDAFMRFCEHHNIRIKKEKVELVTGAVKHLGFILSEEGQALDPARIESLLAIGAPTNLKGLKSLLGSFSFIRGWIAGMADTAAPLTDLMGAQAKRMGFQWGPAQDAALEALKQACQMAPALGSPDYNDTFHVSMDASDVGVGAVLWQWKLNDAGEKIPQAIMYCSRRFSDRERRWEISCRELYAVKYALEKFRTYLQGCHDVIIHTDHLNLVTGLYTHASPKIERWRMFIESFKPFKIQHVRGTDATQQVADGLSRLHVANLALGKCPDEYDEEAMLQAELGEGGMDENMFEAHFGTAANTWERIIKHDDGRSHAAGTKTRQPHTDEEKRQTCTVAHAWAQIFQTSHQTQWQEELQKARMHTPEDKTKIQERRRRYGQGCHLLERMGWAVSEEHHRKMQWETVSSEDEDDQDAQHGKPCATWRPAIKAHLDGKRRPGLGATPTKTQPHIGDASRRKTIEEQKAVIYTYLGIVNDEEEEQHQDTTPSAVPAIPTQQGHTKKRVTFKEAKAAKLQARMQAENAAGISTTTEGGLQKGEREEDEENPRRAYCAVNAVEASETQTDIEDFRQAGKKMRGEFPDADLIKRCHDDTHPSFPVTWRRVVRATGIEPGAENAKLKEQVRHYCDACLTCQKLQPARKRVAARIGSIKKRPFGELAFDVIVLNSPDIEDNRYILTVIDNFSHAVELFPIKKASAEVITTCLHDVLCRWGKPHQVRCDNAKAFAAAVTKQLLQRAKVKQHFCAPYSHNSNGQVENANRRVMDILRAMIMDERLGPHTHLQWSLLLPAVRRVMMSRMVLQYGCCPNDILYTISPENEDSIFREELWMPQSQEPAEERASEFITTLQKQHEVLVEACERKLDEHLEKLAALQEMDAENIEPLMPGDFVLVDMRERPHAKINSPWSGPWQVIEKEDNDPTHPIIWLQHIANKKVDRFNASMCKRCNLDLFEKLEDAMPYAAADNFEYVIEDILDHRPRGERGRKRKDGYEFQVLWSGLERSEDNPSWEPYCNESLRASEPFLRYCRRSDVQAELGKDFVTDDTASKKSKK
jgi:hypothetical protein